MPATDTVLIYNYTTTVTELSSAIGLKDVNSRVYSPRRFSLRRGFIDIFLEFIFKINYMIFNFHLNNTHGHNVASHETLVVFEIIEI